MMMLGKTYFKHFLFSLQEEHRQNTYTFVCTKKLTCPIIQNKEIVMKRTFPRLFAIAITLALVISFFPMQAQPAYAVSPDIVISQVYGGGGNTSAPAATLKNDFIELYNRGTIAVDVTGWSVQYGSATGTTWTGKTILSGVIQPGQY
jgi:hypothetical protein